MKIIETSIRLLLKEERPHASPKKLSYILFFRKLHFRGKTTLKNVISLNRETTTNSVILVGIKIANEEFLCQIEECREMTRFLSKGLWRGTARSLS